MQETLQFSVPGSGTVTPQTSPVKSESHFWGVADSQINSTLYIISPDSPKPLQHQINVYDSLGELANQLTAEFPAGSIGMLDVDALIGDCRCLQGLQQAHLQIVSPAGVVHRLMVYGTKGGYAVSDQQFIDKKRAACFPVTISSGSQNLVCFVNHGKPEALVRCRFFTGNRAPDLEIKIPGNGAVTCFIEKEFAEFIDLPESGSLPAYLRIITNSSADLSAQLIEKEIKEKR